jgi:pimeloyl-ACP methyl ester carboxylesterase
MLTPWEVSIGTERLPGFLATPMKARGLIIFVHGSGSSRFSPRNLYVAEMLQRQGFATLLFDLLTKDESADRRNVFDIRLLGARTASAIAWAKADPRVAESPVGLFGASTGAAAALNAAAAMPDVVAAVVSRGGRPDLAGDALPRVRAPTLLIVGGDDQDVLGLNEAARKAMRCETALVIVPGAGHLFEEPGALDDALRAASDWFGRYVGEKSDA